jgi:hypothetical protein
MASFGSLIAQANALHLMDFKLSETAPSIQLIAGVFVILICLLYRIYIEYRREKINHLEI